MKLITNAQRQTLIENGKRVGRDPAFDPKPVVKLFTPDAACTWLLAYLDRIGKFIFRSSEVPITQG